MLLLSSTFIDALVGNSHTRLSRLSSRDLSEISVLCTSLPEMGKSCAMKSFT